jgi:hypothetical protein
MRLGGAGEGRWWDIALTRMCCILPLAGAASPSTSANPSFGRYTLSLRASSGGAGRLTRLLTAGGSSDAPRPCGAMARHCRSARGGNPGRPRPKPGHPSAFRQEWLLRVEPPRSHARSGRSAIGAPRPLSLRAGNGSSCPLCRPSRAARRSAQAGGKPTFPPGFSAPPKSLFLHRWQPRSENHCLRLLQV